MSQTVAKLQKSKVYCSTRDAFANKYDVVIQKGGTGSGKTYEIMMYLILVYAINNTGKIITVISESMPHLKVGAVRYAEDILRQSTLFSQISYNRSDHIITFPNGTILEFYSTDRIGKAIGARRDMLFGNEINNIKKDVWDEMARRSRYIIADFNPTSKFWLEEWLQYYDRHTIIKSNYKDNKMLPKFEKRRIQKRAEFDENFRRIHVDCEYGIAEGLIFTHWEQVGQFPADAKWIIYGLDFGFSNSPTSIVKIGYYDQALWYDELLYKTGMKNSEIAKFIIENGIGAVAADKAEPKSIEEIKDYGITIEGVDKPQGSVNYGIDLIKQYPMKVTKRSVNMINELRNYKWRVDKNDNITNEPLKMMDHAADASRYGVYYKLGTKKKVAKMWKR